MLQMAAVRFVDHKLWFHSGGISSPRTSGAVGLIGYAAAFVTLTKEMEHPFLLLSPRENTSSTKQTSGTKQRGAR